MLPRALSAALSCVWMLPGRLLMLSEAFPRHFATRGDVVSLSPSRPRRPRRGGGLLLSFVATSARNGQRAPLDRLLGCRGGGRMGIIDTNAPELAAVLDEGHSSEATTTSRPTTSPRTMRPPSTPPPLPLPAGVLEIEEKFDLTSTPDAVTQVERRLRGAGFVLHSVVEMVDWYFDVPTYNLCLHDCWLRYRHQVCVQEPSASTMPKDLALQEGQELSDESASSGGWQLKRGRKMIRDDRDAGSTSRATVYEETEGIHAVALACSLFLDLPEPRDDASLLSRAAMDFDSTYPIPTVPPIPPSTSVPASTGGNSVFRTSNPPELLPFARIVTRRSHWIYKNEEEDEDEDDAVVNNVNTLDSDRPTKRFAGLVVDLDATDFGHAVGEVEALVDVSSDGLNGEEHEGRAVAEARQVIEDFMRLVIHPSGNDGDEYASSVGVSTGTTNNRAPAQGKLECYLERFRPELYRALKQAGAMKRPPGIEVS